MRLLFSMARPFHPFFRSGADVANFEYLAALSRRGFDCRVQGLKPETDVLEQWGGSPGLTVPPPGEPLVYHLDGLSITLYDSPQALLDATVQALHDDPPDRFLTGCAGDRGDNHFERLQLEVVNRAGVPAALLVRDLVETGRVFQGLQDRFRYFIANSRYVASELRVLWGVEAAVVYSVPHPERVAMPTGPRGSYLTMFNPIQPKGVRTVLMLAGFYLPERQFQLVEGWLSFDQIGLRPDLLPNLRLEPRTHDVGSIYARTDCLLVPSIWQEPFGRVVLEAMQNGLPVAASAVGGIPEIMPDSPLLIRDYEDPEAWARALRRLDDPDFRAELVAYSQERAGHFDLDREMDVLAGVLRG